MDEPGLHIDRGFEAAVAGVRPDFVEPNVLRAIVLGPLSSPKRTKHSPEATASVTLTG